MQLLISDFQKKQEKTTRMQNWPFYADLNPKASAVSMQLNFRRPANFHRRLGYLCRRLKNFSRQSIPRSAREKLAVDRFLGQISEPQLSFSVRQKQPATIDDAIAATQELQSHLQLANNRVQPLSEFTIGAVTDSDRSLQQIDRTATLLEQLVTTIEKLETELSTSQRPRPPQSNRHYNRDQQRREGLPRQPRGPIVCFRCGQEGHFARGCASPPVTASQDQGN